MANESRWLHRSTRAQLSSGCDNMRTGRSPPAVPAADASAVSASAFTTTCPYFSLPRPLSAALTPAPFPASVVPAAIATSAPAPIATPAVATTCTSTLSTTTVTASEPAAV